MLFSHSPPTFLKLSGPKFTAGKGAAEGKGKGAGGGECVEKEGEHFPLDVSCGSECE